MACENILAEPSPQPKNSVVSLALSMQPAPHDAEAEMTHSTQPEGLFVSTPPRHEAFPRI
ncbi:hypothetical protein FIBSPDRAFT_849975 [Athelia psychrophila]|uniref:Uncharacterized protein n=1 Tax=Athelia psychrophila TaxID=1759441 RepID=A0A166TT29_9AGAM|nr:hypothetical protein FIBSPDRAFT_849975 [Fibularhizoctonia sp. CBS 109695]